MRNKNARYDFSFYDDDIGLHGTWIATESPDSAKKFLCGERQSCRNLFSWLELLKLLSLLLLLVTNNFIYLKN